MSKSFFRYEDVPLLMASSGEAPVLVFANNATLNVTQAAAPKHFVDDYAISFALQSEDISFVGEEEKTFLMGPPMAPGVKLPQSIEVIKSGSRISYPSGQSLLVAEDVYPGEYYIKVKSTGDTLLRHGEDIEHGEVEVLRNYAAGGAARGTLAVTYYMNTGNIHSFFDVTGLIDPNVYPQVNEGKVTGCLGDYFFDNAYIRDMNFSAQPFQVIQTSVNLDIYGTLRYVEGNAQSIIESYGNASPPLREGQRTVPHAIGTNIEGLPGVGMKYPLSFSYSIAATRNPVFGLPISGNSDEGGEIPVRVAKEQITITANVQGENLDPYLKITGKRADLTIKLEDIGFSEEFTDNNFGNLKDFKIYGVLDSNNLRVAEGGFLAGSATIKQAYR